MDKVADFIHKFQLVRRAVIFSMLYLCFFVYQETFIWVGTIDSFDIHVAAIVASFLAPISALLGHMIKTYAANTYSDGK